MFTGLPEAGHSSLWPRSEDGGVILPELQHPCQTCSLMSLLIRNDWGKPLFAFGDL